MLIYSLMHFLYFTRKCYQRHFPINTRSSSKYAFPAYIYDYCIFVLIVWCRNWPLSTRENIVYLILMHERGRSIEIYDSKRYQQHQLCQRWPCCKNESYGRSYIFLLSLGKFIRVLCNRDKYDLQAYRYVDTVKTSVIILFGILCTWHLCGFIKMSSYLKKTLKANNLVRCLRQIIKW